MEISLIIIFAIIIIFIVIGILFILYKIISKKILKLSIFSGSIGILNRRHNEIGKYSNVINKESSPQESKIKDTNQVNENNAGLSEDTNKPPKKLPVKPTNEGIGLKNKSDKTDKTKQNHNDSNSLNANQSGEGIKSSLTPKVSTPRLIVNTFDDIYKILKNPGITDIVHYFETNNINLIEMKDNPKRINSPKELEEFIRERIINFLKDKHEDLRDKISELRKDGKDMKDAEFILISIPLKIKMFSATFSKKDFDVVIKKIDSVKELLKNIK